MAQAAALAQPVPASGTEAGPPSLRLAPEGSPVRAPVPRLEVSSYAAADALRLERELGVGHVLAQILVRRGMADPAQARRFLDAADAHDPGGFDGIGRALDLIGHHIATGGLIVVHGDYDVDGVCATAIMIRALRSLGAVEKEEDYVHEVGHCDRCHHMLEPQVSEQWWVKMKTLAAPEIHAALMQALCWARATAPRRARW